MKRISVIRSHEKQLRVTGYELQEGNGITGEIRPGTRNPEPATRCIPIDAMTLDKNGDMTTIALINETVEGFERERKYQVHRIGELPWEQEMPFLQENKLDAGRP